MNELFTLLLIILVIYIVYNYQIYKNSLKVGNCTIIYKPE